jgi:hypothetical protein
MTQPVDNERTKFVAAALDRASTGCYVIGVLGPISALYPGLHIPDLNQLFGLVAWFLAGLALHLYGYRLIGSLVDDPS